MISLPSASIKPLTLYLYLSKGPQASMSTCFLKLQPALYQDDSSSVEESGPQNT